MSRERSVTWEEEKKYIKLVMDYPVLTEEKEIELWQQIESNTEEAASARNEIVMSYMKLAVSTAKKYAVSYGDDYETKAGFADFFDLIQAGNVGLLEAIKKFDKEKGRFSAYAAFYIKNEMIKSIGTYSSISLPKEIRSLARKISGFSADFFEKNGYEPSEMDLLKHLKRDDKLSEYDYYSKTLREKLSREPSEDEIREAAKNLIFKIRTITNSKAPMASLDSTGNDEDGDNLYNIRETAETSEDEYEGLVDKDIPEYNLSARELIALRLKYKEDYCTSYISETALENMARMSGIEGEEYNSLYERAMRKIIAHKISKDKECTTENSVTDEAEITKYMNNIVRDMCSDFKGMHCREELRIQYDMMAKSRTENASPYMYWKEELCKNLRLAGLEISGNDDDELLEAIEKLPGKELFLKQLIDVIYNMYRSFPTSEAYLIRIIDRLGCEYINKSFSDKPDSIRVAIVKQFLATTEYGIFQETRNIKGEKKTTNYSVPKLVKKINPELKSCADNDPRLIMAVDERVFEKYDAMTDPKQKKKWKLLKLADDLDKGVFKTNNVTKTNLFIFAFGFGIKAFENKEAANYNPVTDIEKNLFEDYYNNDYTKYLLSAAKNTYEAEPSGEGINYKNFAELIYIYYLNREDLTPANRLIGAEKMIDDCFEYFAVNNKLSEESNEAVNTSIFKNEFWALMSIDASEDIIKEYIILKCNIPKMVENTGKLLAASNSITALEKTEHYIDKIRINSKLKGNINDILLSKAKKITETSEYYDRDDFLKLIGEMSELMDFTRLNTTAEGYKQSRTKLLVAAYYAYQYEEDPMGYSFAEIFDSFASYVDEDLVESRYQRLSTKNIFDVYLVLAIYFTYNIM